MQHNSKLYLEDGRVISFQKSRLYGNNDEKIIVYVQREGKLVCLDGV